SEENQEGWEHHDPALVDERTGRIDTLPFFRAAMGDAGAEDLVVAVVGDSSAVARRWGWPVGLVFIDGGHGEAPAWGDYRAWAPKVGPGCILAIHDVFPDPADGGRPPYELYRRAVGSGAFVEEEALGCGSLRVLRRVAPGL
ncbi:MAG: class I SAM-dependent methyltransferase, partial [Acidimicrobiales bacterium]